MRRARQRWDDPFRGINKDRRIADLTPILIVTSLFVSLFARLTVA